jgi:hypothetical protein
MRALDAGAQAHVFPSFVNKSEVQIGFAMCIRASRRNVHKLVGMEWNCDSGECEQRSVAGRLRLVLRRVELRVKLKPWGCVLGVAGLTRDGNGWKRGFDNSRFRTFMDAWQ